MSRASCGIRCYRARFPEPGGRYGPYFNKIAATASEALHVLDALVYHQDDVTIRRHHTDGGGGDSDHVFAFCTLLGFQLAPRIPDLKHRRIYRYAKTVGLSDPRTDHRRTDHVELIRAHWAEILCIVVSIRAGAVTPSVIMRQLASYPHQKGVAATLRELGRMECTLNGPNERNGL